MALTRETQTANDLQINDEAMPESARFPDGLPQITLDYLDVDIDLSTCSREVSQRFTLFGKDIQSMFAPQAVLTAKHILEGDLKQAEALVKKNPSILYCRIEAKDSLGRKVYGTPLQIAAAAGDVNPIKMKGEKDHGMVERLGCYLPGNKQEKQVAVAKQLNEQFRPGWEKETAERMKPYVTALTQFIDELKEVKVPAGSTLETECKPIVERFKNALKPNPDHVTRSGYIFDSQIFCTAIKQFENNRTHLGDWCSAKSNLFWVIGFGSLQSMASYCDYQIFQHGIDKVIEWNSLPARFLSSSGFYSNPGLGNTYFLDVDGMRQNLAAAVWWTDKSWFKKLCLAKKSALQELMQCPNIQSRSRCLVM